MVGEERKGDDSRRGSDKNLNSVMALWTDKDDAKNNGVENGNNNESKIALSESEGEEEEGYSSDMVLRNMPSRRWSKDEQRKSKEGYSTPDDNWGGESDDKEHSNERDRARKSRKLGN